MYNKSTKVCRLCPSIVEEEKLVNIFDEGHSVTNLKEVILVTTGVEILESDLVSKKVCQRCYNLTLKMFQFRQDALKQDRLLQENCYQQPKGNAENNCLSKKIKISKPDPFLNETKDFISLQCTENKNIHPSVINLFKRYPHIKLPKKCKNINISPFVLLNKNPIKIFDLPKHNQNKKTKVSTFKKIKGPPSKKLKTVAPITITRKLLKGNKNSQEFQYYKYVCTYLPKKRKYKQKFDLKNNNNFQTKVVNKNKDLKFYSVGSLSKDIYSHTRETLSEQTSSLDFSNESSYTKLSATVSVTSNQDNTNVSEIPPQIVATRSQPLFVCHLCGSIHTNAFGLKRHNRKHRICKFCKKKFSSLEANQTHFNLCQVKHMMNSPGPTVVLERIEKNFKIHNKYINAFSSLTKIGNDDVIVLSDDEITNITANSTSNISKQSEIMTSLQVKSSFSVTHPDINIKNNTLLNTLGACKTDKQLVKDLLDSVGLETCSEKNLQTDLPVSCDIDIDHLEQTCTFRSLKENLDNYIIPVTINYGILNVSYQDTTNNNSTNDMSYWEELSVNDVYTKNVVMPTCVSNSVLPIVNSTLNISSANQVPTSIPIEIISNLENKIASSPSQGNYTPLPCSQNLAVLQSTIKSIRLRHKD